MNNWEYSFEPVIGNSYYLYKRKDGSIFLSIIMPHEWGDGYNFEYLQRVEFTPDNNWKKYNDPPR